MIYLAPYLEDKNDPLPRGKRGALLMKDKDKLADYISRHWDYDIALVKVREYFFTSKKYKEQAAAKDDIEQSITFYKDYFNEEPNWSMSPGSEDVFQQLNNNKNLTEEQRIIQTGLIANKQRMMKRITTQRNDIIETLIVEKFENVMPSIIHRRGVDFYIDGMPFDQKVSRSLGSAFIKEHPIAADVVAREHPELVAKSLYENQSNDKNRIGVSPRLYIVTLIPGTDISNVEQTLENTDLISDIKDVNFTLDGKDYTTRAITLFI